MSKCPTSVLPVTSALCWYSCKYLSTITIYLFPFGEFPDDSCCPLKMRLYLRHGLRQCFHYKIHNRRRRRLKRREQRSESNITKQQKNSWRCFVSQHNNANARLARHLLQRQMAAQLTDKHFIGKWLGKRPTEKSCFVRELRQSPLTHCSNTYMYRNSTQLLLSDGP